MLSQKHRLRSQKEIQEIFRKGKSSIAGPLRLRMIRKDRSIPLQIAVLVPSRVAKKAVVRNRLRRRVREVVRLSLPRLLKTGWNAVLLVEKDITNMPLDYLREAVEDVFSKASLRTK